MSFRDFIARLFSSKQQPEAEWSVADYYGPNRDFDRAAARYSTNGVRWDGSSYDAPYRPPQLGYDESSRDFLSPNFGSQLHQTSSGEWQGIASAEVKRGSDGLFRRLFDFSPRRSCGLDSNDHDLGREDDYGVYS